MYSNYLVSIGRYECAIVGRRPEIVMKYFNQAEKIAEKLSGYEELKSYIYYTKATLQVTTGNITNAKKYVQKAEEAQSITPKTFLGEGLIEYNKAQICRRQISRSIRYIIHKQS